MNEPYIHTMQAILPHETLRTLGVKAVYFFGSRAENTAGPLSDYDLAFFFSDVGYVRENTRRLYDALYRMLTDAGLTNNFTPVDIVFIETASLELQFSIIRDGTVVFDESPDARLAFEERISLLHMDYRPLLDDFNRNILARI